MAISATVVKVGVMPCRQGITPTGVLQHLKSCLDPVSRPNWGIIAVGQHLLVVLKYKLKLKPQIRARFVAIGRREKCCCVRQETFVHSLLTSNG